MSEKGLTTMSVKKINKNKVYSFIYKEGITSKMQIVQRLEMGLSTVNQNLKLLEEEGLIEKNGSFDSTGGRKAQAIQIVKTAKTAIGIGILKKMVHLVAIDLYGTPLCETTIPFLYRPDSGYYEELSSHLTLFIEENQILPSSILGVSIATQGIISLDGQTVNYGILMNNSSMELKDFERCIPYPCHLEHDSKAAAALELWNHSEVKNAVIVLLNRNLGGAIIIDGEVRNGNHMRSGIIEHICIDPEGPLCYCGSHGCLETYCSAGHLESAAEMDVPSFFAALRNKPTPELTQVWKNYLDHLAFAIRNLNIIMDGTTIISGYLAPYFIESDVDYLLEKINFEIPFELPREQLIIGSQGQYTPAIGSALYNVKKFISSI